MSARIYIEGGGESKELHIRCRAGFRALLDKCGFGGRMPALKACGGCAATFEDFKTAHKHASANEDAAMLIDSETPVADVERTWAHLKQSDGWNAPQGADDKQVLLMTTCMETWIASDVQTLKQHYGKGLRAKALLPLHNLESQSRQSVQDALVQATKNCKAGYAKGKRSFDVLAKLDPAVLRQHLPSFERCQRVLKKEL